MTVDEIEKLCDLFGCDFADFYAGKPIRYGVMFEQVEVEDYEAVCGINQIVKNLSEMHKLLVD